MNQTEIESMNALNAQLERAEKILEETRAELASFHSQVEAEAKDLEKRVYDANHSHLKGRAGWLDLLKKKH